MLSGVNEVPENGGVDQAQTEKSHGKRPITKAALSFPYVSLEDVVGLAQAMLDAGGVPLLRDQVAHAMNTTADHGTFNLKISAARMFDLIAFQDNKFQLTAVGNDIISPDENTQRAARREAFLRVDLYRKAVEHFRGKSLPNSKAGLEAALVSFGIAEKQKDKARQAFEKSAIFAGFMDSSKSRLVEPVIAKPPENKQKASDSPKVVDEETLQQETRNNDVPFHPFVKGLLDEMPPPRTIWAHGDRAKWLRAASQIFDLIYKPDIKNMPKRAIQIVCDSEDLTSDYPTPPRQ